MPVLDTLVELVTRGRCIPVHLSSLPRLESLVAEVQAWKECAAKTFLIENSPYSLLEVSLQPACHTAQVTSWGHVPSRSFTYRGGPPQPGGRCACPLGGLPRVASAS